VRFTVDSPKRLDLFLVGKLPDESRSSIARAVEDGRVLVNGVERKVSYKLHEDDVVSFQSVGVRRKSEPEPIAIPLEVPYEDDHLLVVTKPAGLATHPSPTSKEPTLVNALLARNQTLSTEGGPFRPGIVHRLDKGTSGLLLVAKSDIVHRKLQAAIQRKEVVRTYWAWVRGKPKQDSFVVRSFIGRHPKDRKKQAVVSESTADARLAITHCKLLNWSAGISKIECTLETGRTHQIRVHLAAVGLPVLGDREYGIAHEGLLRQALHAVSLRFDHPVSGERIEVTAALPDDLALVD